VVRRGAKLLHAFAEATVPRVTLVTRKPTAGLHRHEQRRMGAPGVCVARRGVAVMARGRRAHPAPAHARRRAPDQLQEAEARLAEEHERGGGGLERARALGVIDEVIEPSTTREAIVRAIAAAPQVRGPARNIRSDPQSGIAAWEITGWLTTGP